MKNVLLSLMMAASLIVGCSSSERSPGSLGQGSQPQRLVQPSSQSTDSVVIAPENRLSSALFFMAVNLIDDQSKQNLVNAVFLVPNASIFKDGVYRGDETIELGSITPDKIQLVAPVPPEFGSSDSVTVSLHYGCGGNRTADFYPFAAELKSVDYEVDDGMSRYYLASDQLRSMFSVCENTESKVSVVVEFHDSTGRVRAWEQVYLRRDRSDPEVK